MAIPAPKIVDAVVTDAVRCRGRHSVKARWFHDHPSRHRDFAKLVRWACDPAISEDTFASLVWRQEARKTLPGRIMEGEREHLVGFIRRLGGASGLRGVLRRLANGTPVSPNPPPAPKTRDELEATRREEVPYQGEWTKETLGCREALEFLRAAANSPGISAEAFAGIVDQMLQAGTMPDRLTRPDGSGYNVRTVLDTADEDALRDILRPPAAVKQSLLPLEKLHKPPTPTGPCRESTEDDSEDIVDEEERRDLCPVCGAEQCSDHCLACFDVTFADQGQGEYRAGLIGGTLYGVDEIGKALNTVRLAWVQSTRLHGAPIQPGWMTDPALVQYFDAMGTGGDFNPAAWSDAQEAADELARETTSHAVVARECLEQLLSGVGWGGLDTRWTVEVPLFSTAYLSWWSGDPQAIAVTLGEKLRSILERARIEAV